MIRILVAGPWDLGTTSYWLITLLIIGVAPISPFRGILRKAISPIISSY